MIGTSSLVPTGSDEYIVPYRLTSQTGKFYINKQYNDTKAIFTIFRGFHKSSILLYTSRIGEISENAFNFGLYQTDIHDIKQLDTHWYTAIIEY
jgi:hypothetical protein